jgi:hypothetical protein
MTERFTDAIKRLLAAVLPDFDLYALHPATVLNAAPNEVDVRFDNSRLPELTSVPVRAFAPEVQILVAAQTRVLVGFEGGDRNKPVALLWGAGNFTALSIGSGNTQPVARVTDSTRGFIPVGTVLVMSPNGIPIPNPAPIPVDGNITSGSSKVRCD